MDTVDSSMENTDLNMALNITNTADSNTRDISNMDLSIRDLNTRDSKESGSIKDPFARFISIML